MSTAVFPIHEGYAFEDFEPLARWVIVVATAEARLARHPIVTSAHVMLALWLAETSPTGVALRRAGMSGRVAKAWVDHEIRPARRADEPELEAALLDRARVLAGVERGGRVAERHLFAAATESPEADGLRMIRAQGISPDRIQSAVESMIAAPPPASLMERLDESAQAVVVAAGGHARRLDHAEVTPGHLLLGLIETPSAARDTLRGERVTAEAAGVALLAITGRGEGGPTDHVPFSPASDEVFLRAARHAGSGAVTPPAMLRALLEGSDGDHTDVLRALGADLDRLRTTNANSSKPPPASRASTDDARRRPALHTLQLRRPSARSRVTGWRPELLLVALAMLSIFTDGASDPWVRIGLASAAIGAIAIGTGAFVRAWTRSGPWRPIRLSSSAALTVAAVALLLGDAFG